MVSIKYIWDRLNDYGSKYQSGMDIVTSFNSKIAEVQLEIYNDLSPAYQANEKVRELLTPWVVKTTATSASNGQITLPDGADRVVSIGITATGAISYPVSPITEGELVSYSRIPQRKPDATKQQVYFLTLDPLLVELQPNIALPYLMFYFIFPTEAKIVFTYTTSADEDVMTYDPTDSVDLAWTENASNIILYKMLEKYGIAQREMWLSEYAKLGISESISTGGQSK